MKAWKILAEALEKTTKNSFSHKNVLGYFSDTVFQFLQCFVLFKTTALFFWLNAKCVVFSCSDVSSRWTLSFREEQLDVLSWTNVALQDERANSEETTDRHFLELFVGGIQP